MTDRPPASPSSPSLILTALAVAITTRTNNGIIAAPKYKLPISGTVISVTSNLAKNH